MTASLARRLARRLARAAIVLSYVLVAFVLLYSADASSNLGLIKTALLCCALMGITLLPYAGFAMAFVVVVLLLLKRKLFVLASLPLVVVCVWPWAGGLVQVFKPTAPSSHSSVLILTANLLSSSDAELELIKQIQREKPDVILLQEVNDISLSRLVDALGDDFVYTAVPRNDNFGQAVFSRLPMTRTTEPAKSTLHPAEHPQQLVWVRAFGREIGFWNIHLVPPVSRSTVRLQARASSRLGELVQQSSYPIVVAGDFNSPWAGQPMQPLRALGYRDAVRDGRGSTWPKTGALRVLPGVQIDHIAVPRAFSVIESWIGSSIGSDHAPVFARIRLMQDSSTEEPD